MARSSLSGASVRAAPPTASLDAAPAGPIISTARTSAVVAAREPRPRTRLRSSGLEQKAAAELEWVTDDLRRIAVISAIMIAGLAMAWLLLVVVGLGDFY